MRCGVGRVGAGGLAPVWLPTQEATELAAFATLRSAVLGLDQEAQGPPSGRLTAHWKSWKSGGGAPAARAGTGEAR